MTRSRGWRAAVMVAGLSLAAALAATGPAAWAKPLESAPPEPAFDLIAHTPATATTPAFVRLRVTDFDEGAALRVRLYPPPTTRAELVRLSYNAATTPVIATWMIEDLQPADSDGGTIVSIPIPIPTTGSDGAPANGSGRPLPLHIELVTPDGVVVDTLRTFLTPLAAIGGADLGRELSVTIVLDLRLPPAHAPDGGAQFDPDLLGRVLDLAEVLIDRAGAPLTVEISPETFDALALVGDDASVSTLRAALDGRQILTSPWTSLEVDDWIEAGHADVAIDGLRRSAETRDWIGIEASSAMRFEEAPSPAAASFFTGPIAAVTGFVARVPEEARTESEVPDAVSMVADSAGGRHPMAQADPLLEQLLRHPDSQLAAQWVLAELLRIANAANEPDAVVVFASAVEPHSALIPVDDDGQLWEIRHTIAPGIEPSALALLLDGLTSHANLRPATVDTVLASVAPVGTVTGRSTSTPTDPGDFLLYLRRLGQVEQRLHAYESFIGTATDALAPLHTLLAVSVNPLLTTGERTDFLQAVDRQATLGATDVDLVERGRITVTERSTDLPVTIVNGKATTVTVALELASDSISFPESGRPIVRLEPGRNDLSVPIEARSAGDGAIEVVVTTPDETGRIILSTGTLNVRYTAVSGLGTLVLVAAGAAVAVWWFRARRRSLVSAETGATVAPSDLDGPRQESGPRSPVTPEIRIEESKD